MTNNFAKTKIMAAARKAARPIMLAKHSFDDGRRRTIWNSKVVTPAERTRVWIVCWSKSRWTRWLHCWCSPTTSQRTRRRTAAGTNWRTTASDRRRRTATSKRSRRRQWRWWCSVFEYCQPRRALPAAAAAAGALDFVSSFDTTGCVCSVDAAKRIWCELRWRRELLQTETARMMLTGWWWCVCPREVLLN